MTERKGSKRPTEDYPVGYGKPPVEHQFKKGQPRPPRKPKPEGPTPSFEDYLEQELAETMGLKENGVQMQVPKGKALAKAAIAGAIEKRDPRRLKGFLRPAKTQEEFDFSSVNLAIVARALVQVLQHLPPADGEDGGRSEEGDEGEGEV